MRKIFGILILALFFVACETEPMAIICGREWNATSQVVADTGSVFALNEPLVVQFKNGKAFEHPTLTISFYEDGKLIWNRDANVTNKMNSYTLQGKSKKGGLMSARELTRKKTPGKITIEVSANNQVLMKKEITLEKNK